MPITRENNYNSSTQQGEENAGEPTNQLRKPTYCIPVCLLSRHVLHSGRKVPRGVPPSIFGSLRAKFTHSPLQFGSACDVRVVVHNRRARSTLLRVVHIIFAAYIIVAAGIPGVRRNFS